jgi:hypothetical protein
MKFSHLFLHYIVGDSRLGSSHLWGIREWSCNESPKLLDSNHLIKFVNNLVNNLWVGHVHLAIQVCNTFSHSKSIGVCKLGELVACLGNKLLTRFCGSATTGAAVWSITIL